MPRKTNESISNDIAILKTMMETTQEDIKELKEKIIGNGREGLISRVSRLETTFKIMAFALSLGIPLIIAILNFLRI